MCTNISRLSRNAKLILDDITYSHSKVGCRSLCFLDFYSIVFVLCVSVLSFPSLLCLQNRRNLSTRCNCADYFRFVYHADVSSGVVTESYVIRVFMIVTHRNVPRGIRKTWNFNKWNRRRVQPCGCHGLIRDESECKSYIDMQIMR